MPNVYLVLNTPNSECQPILQDLIDLASPNALTLVHGEELESLPSKQHWVYNNSIIETPNVPLHEFEDILFITHSKLDIIDQIEAFKAFLHKEILELARVISIINCNLAYNNKDALAYFEALVHFSDYVILTNREDVPQKWINEFIKSFEKQHYPCIFEQVKNNRCKNPNLVLDPSTRRISHYFDPEEDRYDDLEIDEESLPTEPFNPKVEDPYIARNDDGSRKIKLPNISDFM